MLRVTRAFGFLRRRHIIWALTAALAVLACAQPAAAQRFEWRDVEQRVEILPSGDVIVDDVRTLWTDADFGEAYIEIRLAPGQRVELLEESGALSPGPPAEARQQRVSGGEELVVRQEERVSERRVRFHYRLSGSLDVYSDVVQWYWNILGREDVAVIGYSLEVVAPGPMAEPYDAFVHRYGHPEAPRVELSQDRSWLTVAFDRIPSADGVEIRYLMEPSLFAVQTAVPGLEGLLRDQERIAGLDALRRSAWWAVLGVALVGLLALAVALAYVRHGREPDVGPVMRYPFEPPSDIPPAAVSALRQLAIGLPGGAAFKATIMDLARRGYGTFEPKDDKFEMRLDLGKDDRELERFERQVLQ